MLSSFLSLSAFVASALASPIETRATCSGAHVLWARGSYETYANSTLLPLVNKIATTTGGSSSAIIYPATVINATVSSDYDNSVAAGINNTILQIKQYVASCGSSSRVVLVGYSQGGQVMTDTLVGGAFEPAGIDSSYWKYITASVVFGDPTFTYPSKYAAGNATTSGISQRFQNDPTEVSLNNNFANTLRSYCTVNDPICAGLEFTNAGAHQAEVRDHQAAAQAFVLGFR
ncbi:hypothetical protein AMS68_006784 [Peltaster fructicola]|uniref:Cutinase n=1 Tax=Peltaster fructicola TaxID=286661 RepID=A0A6H0Y2N9_9PEZI|nr:hypothetical protein AMS68_006784 [Peltaster fructicola]